MTSTTDRKPLSLPQPQPLQFERNYLKTVVCELKFPTLLELETQQPLEIRNALKKEYPHYAVVRSLGLQASGVVDQQVPNLSSLDRRWVVTVRPSAISLETAKYRSFEELRDRVTYVTSKALPFLDTSFFTRVGLRYINHLPLSPSDAAKAINPALVGPLEAGVFGDFDSCFQEIRGSTVSGGKFSLRHGYPPSEEGPTQFVFDADLSREPVEASDLTSVLDEFHVVADSLFQWAVLERGRNALGVVRKKGE